jgi:hypothetical protein
MTEHASTEQIEQQEIVARPARYYRITRYVVVLMFLAMGGWFLYDGFIGYPAENEAARAQGHREPHSDLDLALQKALGTTLPPIGIAMLVWALYNSRGSYRLSGSTLHVPGHPPVELDQIRRIDKNLWDRKGIAFIDYERPDGTESRLKLDDFVYEREPTDAIFERIEQHLLPADTPAEQSA